MDGVPSSGRQIQIMTAAAELFNARGFHETSMEDIATAVGVKKPTLYHHVKSKAQIIEWIHDECVRAVSPPLQKYLSEDRKPSEILRLVAIDIFSVLDTKPGYLRVYFEHYRDLDPKSKVKSRLKRDAYYNDVRRVIARGNESGEFSVEDTELAAIAFFGMCNWGYQWYRPDGPKTAEQLGEYFASLFITGILHRGTST